MSKVAEGPANPADVESIDAIIATARSAEFPGIVRRPLGTAHKSREDR